MAAKKTPVQNHGALFFVSGNDESEVKQCAARLALGLSPGDDPFATEIIDGAVGTVDEAVDKIGATLDALLTVPMFGGNKFVWLKSAGFFADSPAGKSDSVTGAVEKLMEVLRRPLPEGVRFLLSAPEADKRKTVFKELSKLCETTICDKPDFGWNSSEADVVNWILERASEKGLSLSMEAAEVFAARVGVETRQVDCEIEKLLVAFGSRSIGAQDLRAIVPSTKQGGIFDLSTAILQKDLTGSLEVMEQLRRQRTSAVEILLVAIAPTVRNLLLVVDLMKKHRLSPPAKSFFFTKTLNALPPGETAHLPRKKDGTLNAYPLGLAAVAAPLFRREELREVFLECRNVNRLLVSSSVDEEMLLGGLLIRLLGGRRGA